MLVDRRVERKARRALAAVVPSIRRGVDEGARRYGTSSARILCLRSHSRDALDGLRAERIDHGVRCVEDDALVDRLVREQPKLRAWPSTT